MSKDRDAAPATDRSRPADEGPSEDQPPQIAPAIPVHVERCELVTAAVKTLNHPDLGVVLFADLRVPDDELDSLIDSVRSRVADTPERVMPPSTRARLASAETQAAMRAEFARILTATTRRLLRQRRAEQLAVVGQGSRAGTSSPGKADPAFGDPPTQPRVSRQKSHPAGVYDYLLGGKDNTHADRVAADALSQQSPNVRESAIANRAFMHRAVTMLAEAGITQFIDVGAGIPTSPNAHEVAQRINPAARVLSVDNDPVILVHANARTSSTAEGRTAYLLADARDPDAILDSPEYREIIDPSQPIGIILVAIAHFVPDAAAQRLVSTLLNAAPPGSYLALSHVTLEGDDLGRISSAITKYHGSGMAMHPRTRKQIETMFLDGLEVVEPGIVSVQRWRWTDAVAAELPHHDNCVWGVVARKPKGADSGPPRSSQAESTHTDSATTAHDRHRMTDTSDAPQSETALPATVTPRAISGEEAVVKPPPDVRTDQASSARTYDYLLGGKDNFEVDREAAARAKEANPSVAIGARSNRRFMNRAARAVAALGIDQFVDIGTGIPTEPNLHQIVQAENPEIQIVYVDKDPIVLSHAAALMNSPHPGPIAFLSADAEDPQSILDSPEFRENIDPTRPICFSIIALLHFLHEEAARRLVRTLLTAANPGSFLIMSHATEDFDTDGSMAKLSASYTQSGMRNWLRSRGDVERLFLTGLDVLDPGIVANHRWRPDSDPRFSGVTDAEVYSYGVVARKP